MPSTNGHGSKPERVGLYMRVSSEEQKTKDTIETQDGFLEEYCKLYGRKIAKVYKDAAALASCCCTRGQRGVNCWKTLRLGNSMWCCLQAG